MKKLKTDKETRNECNQNENEQSLCDILTSVRLRMVLMVLFSKVLIDSPRFIMPMALTCMVAPRNTNTSLNTTYTDENYEFDWGADVIATILLAPFFTLWLSPLLGEALRSKVDSKLSTLVWLGASATLTFLTPVAARTSPYLVVAIFALQGVTIVS